MYARSLLVNDFLFFTYLIVLVVFFHYLINNRYIAYFVFMVFIMASDYVVELLKIESLMVSYGAISRGSYSDVNGFGPWATATAWFQAYWGAFALLLLYVAYLFFIRGKTTAMAGRCKDARERLAGSRVVLFVFLGAFFAIGANVYYNTQVLNSYETSKEVEDKQVAYEETNKIYQDIPQLQWVSMKYQIELYPQDRGLTFEVIGVMENMTEEPISEIHFTIFPDSKSNFSDRNRWRYYSNERRSAWFQNLWFDASLTTGGAACHESFWRKTDPRI